ncbi:MAG: hypothetical protein R6X20_18105 [Phycisphaerae bacterium]
MRPTLTAILALALAASPAAAGVVRTVEARLEGNVAFADGAVRVAGKAVPWTDVVYVIGDPEVRTVGPPEAVLTVDDQVWRGEVLRLSADRLTVHLPLFGEREVPLDRIAVIQFTPPPGSPSLVLVAAPRPPSPGTLLRHEGEPLPGTLLWIDGRRLALDSPLGAVTLDRDGCLAYVFRRDGGKAAAEDGKDRLTLVNGTVLLGKATVGDGAVRLAHKAFGRVEIDGDLVRRLARHDPRVRRLEFGGVRAPFRREIAVPREPGRPAEFVARLGPLPGARGDARVRLAVGDTVLLEREVGPDDDPVAVREPLPPQGKLSVTVAYGKRIGFPCGVRVEDAMCIVAEPDAR